MSIFKEKCKHEWEIIVNEYEKSQLEKINEKGSCLKGTFAKEMILGRKIIILQCKKCGKLDKTIDRD